MADPDLASREVRDRPLLQALPPSPGTDGGRPVHRMLIAREFSLLTREKSRFRIDIFK
jgi:hypothetical protein